MQMLLSVVLPTRDRPEMLRDLLRSMQPSLEWLRSNGHQFEILVCNDGSQLPSADLPVEGRWLDGPHAGPAANRNTGAAAARGEFLVFVDDDCLASPTWLRAYVEAIEAGRGGGIDIFEGRTTTDRPARRLDEVSPTNETGGFLWTCNLVVRRSAFNSLGSFDESFPFPAMEDVEFRRRIHLAGLGVRFVPDAVVLHPFRVRRPIFDMRRHKPSVENYLRLHPDEAHRFSRRYYVATMLRHVRSLGNDAIRMRGRGMPRALLNIACVGYQAITAPQASRENRVLSARAS